MFLYPIVDWDYLQQKNISFSQVSATLYKTNFYQLRIKNQTIEKIKEIIKKTRQEFPDVKIILNDYLELCFYSNGVHLGVEDLEQNKEEFHQLLKAPFVFAPNIEEWKTKSQFLIGVSTHNYEQFEFLYKTYNQYIGYLAIGPCFPTTTKDSQYPVVSEKEFNKIFSFVKKNQIQKSLVFIGGIQKENLKILYDRVYSFFQGTKTNFYYASISGFLQNQIPLKFDFTL